VEDSKRLISDKSFRNKQERDRRVRELNSNNMKKFIEERKRLANKHSLESQSLAKIVKEEEDSLNDENNKVNNFKLLFYSKCYFFFKKTVMEYIS
jgi:phosphatidylinositol phospholipase C beta